MSRFNLIAILCLVSLLALVAIFSHKLTNRSSYRREQGAVPTVSLAVYPASESTQLPGYIHDSMTRKSRLEGGPDHVTNFFRAPNPALTTDDVVAASTGFKHLNGDGPVYYYVDVTLNEKGRQRLEALSRAQLKSQISIHIDGKPKNIPRIEGLLTKGWLQISEFDSQEEAETAAKGLVGISK